MEAIIFEMAVISLMIYFVHLTIEPNISLLEILIVSVSGGVVLQDLHELIKKIFKKEKETGVS